MKNRRVRPKQQIVWASQLAEMALCERRLVWNAKLGEQLTPRQRMSAAAGVAVHAALHRQSLRINPGVRTTKPSVLQPAARATMIRLPLWVNALLRRWLEFFAAFLRRLVE